MQEEQSPEKESDAPLLLVSQVGAAALLGLSKQRVHQLFSEGRLPAPYAIIDGKRACWLPSAFLTVEQPDESSYPPGSTLPGTATA